MLLSSSSSLSFLSLFVKSYLIQIIGVWNATPTKTTTTRSPKIVVFKKIHMTQYNKNANWTNRKGNVLCEKLASVLTVLMLYACMEFDFNSPPWKVQRPKHALKLIRCWYTSLGGPFSLLSDFHLSCHLVYW